MGLRYLQLVISLAAGAECVQVVSFHITVPGPKTFCVCVVALTSTCSIRCFSQQPLKFDTHARVCSRGGSDINFNRGLQK